MKELSIEEKAKEFDASLERAKKLIETCDSTPVIGWCEYIFPMLKESEWERIRKGMLRGFKDYGEPEYVWWEGVKVKECIAWLEKQGEQKLAWSEEDEEQVNIITNIVQAHCGKLIDCCANLKWLKALKDRVQPQPKQEWNESDKEEFQIAIDTLVEAGQHDSAHWLKSLKERMQ